MLAAPILESLGARQSVEELAAVADGLGGGERLASRVDGSMMVPRAMVEAVGSSRVEAGVTDAALEVEVEKPAVPEEQMALPETPKGMVRHDVQPRSPLVVPPAAVEEDEVEEIEREESRPQAI